LEPLHLPDSVGFQEPWADRTGGVALDDERDHKEELEEELGEGNCRGL